jgi:hypothetical protein
MTKHQTHVRVVGPNEAPSPPKPLTLAEAIEEGNYLQILYAQRRQICNSLSDEKGPAAAALHRQLSLLSREIEALEVGTVDAVVMCTPDESWDQTAI